MDSGFITYFKLRNLDLKRIELKRVWVVVLSFFLGVGMIASVKVLASVLATIVGGPVEVI